MNFDEALVAVADYLSLDVAALREYAAEDTLGGWTYLGYWPGGSIWEVEGRILYAIIRGLQPKSCFEAGTKFGCSASHILSALKANKKGTLTSVDPGFDTDLTTEGYGSLIPEPLKKKWKFNFGQRAEDFLDADSTPFEFAYEDTDHTVPTTVAILSRLKARESVKVIMSHDVCHPWAGYAIRDAWNEVFGNEWRPLCTEPSDCGLAIWRRP